MFIFSFKRKTFKVLGESNKRICKSCNNERRFKSVEEKTWFALFFLSLFSYKTRKIFICPVCSMGFEDKGDIEVFPIKKPKTEFEIKKEVESNYIKIKEKLDNGEISKNEFIRICNVLNYEVKAS